MSGDEFSSEKLWGVQIARLHKIGSLFVQDRLQPLGLGTGLHPYLLALEARPLHQEALSELLCVDKANTARAVAKLEFQELVVRREQGGDRRLKVVELTAKGQDLLVPIKAVLDMWESRLREGMSEHDAQELDRLLTDRVVASRGLPTPIPSAGGQRQ